MLAEQSGRGDSSGDHFDPWQGRPGAGSLDHLRRFVHQWFGWLDRGAPVERLVAHLATTNLTLQLPEGKVSSYREFRNWHANWSSRYRRVRHELHEVVVAWDREDGYTVDLWGRRLTEAASDGRSHIATFRQKWHVRTSPSGALEIERLEARLLG
jgi:hypothetical protein